MRVLLVRYALTELLLETVHGGCATRKRLPITKRTGPSR